MRKILAALCIVAVLCGVVTVSVKADVVSGANTINLTLGSLAASVAGIDVGSTTQPFRFLYLYGAGTYATTYLKFTGTPTSTRTVTFPDATDTVAELGQAQTFTAAQTYSATVNLNGTLQGNSTTKALTSGAAAVAVVVVAIPSGTTAGGSLDYCFEATDNTDFQSRCGIIPFAAINKAGAITCTVGTVSTATEVVAVSTGTLTATWSCADGTGGNLQLKATDTSSLTIGAGYDRLRYRVSGLAPSALTVTPQ